MIDSIFISHQNTSKEFKRSSCINFGQNELESPIMAKIWDNFKGFPMLFCHVCFFITSKQIKLESPATTQIKEKSFPMVIYFSMFPYS